MCLVLVNAVTVKAVDEHNAQTKQDSAAIRDFAQDVDGSGRKGATEERELTVHGREGGPQDSAAVRDFAQGVDFSFRRAQRSESKRNVRGWVRGAVWRDRPS